jgi:hypothetical protein
MQTAGANIYFARLSLLLHLKLSFMCGQILSKYLKFIEFDELIHSKLIKSHWLLLTASTLYWLFDK